MRMKLRVEPTGSTTATVVFTQEQVDRIRGVAGRARVPVEVSFGDQRFRTSISVYRGQWMMVVNREMRDGGLTPGGTYQADVALDAGERTVEVPRDFLTAMRKAGVLKQFEALAYTHRREHVRVVEEAKKPETRQRRIEAAIAKVGGQSAKSG